MRKILNCVFYKNKEKKKWKESNLGLDEKEKWELVIGFILNLDWAWVGWLKGKEVGCLRGNEMGLSGLFGKWIKIKRNGLKWRRGNSSRSGRKGAAAL